MSATVASAGLAAHPIIGFVPTRDFGPAEEFYAKTLGLRLLAKDNFALLFEVSGARMRVAKVESFVPAQFTILGWRVPDLKSMVLALNARGVTFERFAGMNQDESGIWTSPSGARVAWFTDPDGNILSLSQEA